MSELDDFEALKLKFERLERRLKESLLAGADVEKGRLTAELRLRDGRDPESKNPDDYDLLVLPSRENGG